MGVQGFIYLFIYLPWSLCALSVSALWHFVEQRKTTPFHFQQENLVWKKHRTRQQECAKTKRIQALLSSFGRAEQEMKLVPPCWELVRQASLLLSPAEELLDSSAWEPFHRGLWRDRSRVSLSFYLYPIAHPPHPGPPEMGYLQAVLLVLAHTHRAMGLKAFRRWLTFFMTSLQLFLSPPVVEASSNSRELPFRPLLSLLRTKLSSQLAWLFFFLFWNGSVLVFFFLNKGKIGIQYYINSRLQHSDSTFIYITKCSPG